jgi:hypothetical protein
MLSPSPPKFFLLPTQQNRMMNILYYNLVIIHRIVKSLELSKLTRDKSMKNNRKIHALKWSNNSAHERPEW